MLLTNILCYLILIKSYYQWSLEGAVSLVIAASSFS